MDQSHPTGDPKKRHVSSSIIIRVPIIEIDGRGHNELIPVRLVKTVGVLLVTKGYIVPWLHGSLQYCLTG